MKYIKLFENFSIRYFDTIYTLDELITTYRDLVKKYHPDRAGRDEAEVERLNKIMQEINSQKQQAEERIKSSPNYKKKSKNKVKDEKAEEEYRFKVEQAKAKLERANELAKKEFDESLKSNPSLFRNIRFIYQEKIRQNNKEYQDKLEKANRELKSKFQ